MYLQKGRSSGALKVTTYRKEQDPKPEPDPLVKGSDPRNRMRIRIFSCHGSGTPLAAKLYPDPHRRVSLWIET
jgi:hypothetical protein